MGKTTSYQKNIKISYILRFIQGAWLPLSTALLFFQHNGLTLDQVFFLKAVASVAAMLLEVPTGYFADRFGRKRSLLIAGVAATLSPLVYYLSSTLPMFVLAELLLAAGVSFMSGADSALVYDSLLAEGKEDDYGKCESRMSAITASSEGVCALLGGFLASFDLKLPFLAQAGLFTLFLPLAAMLREPSRPQHREESKESIATIVTSTLARPSVLRYLVFASAWSATGTFLIVWFSQAFLESVHVPVLYFGVAWAGYHLCLAVAAALAPRVARRFSRNTILIALSVGVSVGFLGLSLSRSPWGIVFVLIIYAVRGLRTPLVRVWVNEIVETHKRATTLSTLNLLFRLMFVVTGPALGLLSRETSLPTTFAVISLLWLAPGLYWVRRLNRYTTRGNLHHS